MKINGIGALDYKAAGYGTGRTKRTTAGSGAWNPMQDYLQNLLQGGNPLQQRSQEAASAQVKEDEQKEEGADNQKEAESDSEIITQADGSRILMITNQIGSMKTVTSIRLSKPNPLQNDYVKKNTEENMRSVLSHSSNSALNSLR